MIVLFAWIVAAPPVSAADRAPDGLSSSDWSGIRAAYEAKRHEAFAVDDGYQARNPGQRWLTRFDGRGFETTPDAGAWSWGLELVSFDVAPANSRCLGMPLVSNQCKSIAPAVSACGPRIEYDWDDTLTEWFINDRRGLEQGFTVHKRQNVETPKSQKVETSKSRNSLVRESLLAPPLQLTLAVRGNLRPQITGNGRNVTFVDSTGAAVVNYNGLTAFDATGKTLPAWFEAADFNSAFSILHSPFVRIIIDDSDATYPLTIDPIAQQAYLKASNTGHDDQFGWSVAVSGDTVVVGARFEDSSATGVDGNGADNNALDSGAAYVFVCDGGIWSQQAYLKPSNTDADDQFGRAVAISGDTVVVGAPDEAGSATGVNGNGADNSTDFAGAAYVFVRSRGVWSQQAYLKASNTGASDNFGISVAVSDDTVVVGALGEDSSATGVEGNQADNSATESGAAYVFFRSGTLWSQQTYLKASNTDMFDKFGISVAASGDTVVVGATGEASSATGVDGDQVDNSASFAGAVYVFVRAAGIWTQQAYLKASNTGGSDQFGYSVAISGDKLAVGAVFEDSSATGVNGNGADNSASASGAAYVFVRDVGGVWSHQAYLKASNTGASDFFGWSVAASGYTVVVGAPLEDSIATVIDGDQADNSANNSGAAYTFVGNGTAWSQQAYLKASNTGAGDNFGVSVAVSGDTVVVGAPGEDSSATGVDGDQDDNSASNSGAAYVFTICPLFPADMNCDCAVDPSDVEPFVQALLDPVAYAAAHPGCDILNADLQPDGNVDAADAQAFVDLLVP